MHKLYDEITARFPEVQIDEFDRDSPYTMMITIADWLASPQVSCTHKDIIKRVAQFKDWCENQERGKSADDDIFTIFTVSFLEHIFENSKTQ